MTAAVFPGSFDPFTQGHLDLVRRASRLFDPVSVVIFRHPDKPGWLSLATRRAIIERSLAVSGLLGAVGIQSAEGLLTDYMRTQGVHVVVRGVRAARDWSYEAEMQATNCMLWPEFEAVYLGSRPELAHVSSSRVRELWRLGGPLDGLVPEAALPLLPTRGQSPDPVQGG